jgi:hypothetical protein
VVRRFRNQMFGTTQSRREMEVKGFRIACGEFIGVSDVREEELEQPGMALVPQGIRYAKGMFAARSRGDSMEPKISDGMWCLFHPDVVGTRHDRFVLVEDQSKISGDRYTLKKYHSRKMAPGDITRFSCFLRIPGTPLFASKTKRLIVFAVGLWTRFRKSNLSNSFSIDMSQRSRRNRPLSPDPAIYHFDHIPHLHGRTSAQLGRFVAQESADALDGRHQVFV